MGRVCRENEEEGKKTQHVELGVVKALAGNSMPVTCKSHFGLIWQDARSHSVTPSIRVELLSQRRALF
jgi:hypothetical protein